MTPCQQQVFHLFSLQLDDLDVYNYMRDRYLAKLREQRPTRQQVQGSPTQAQRYTIHQRDLRFTLSKLL